MHPSLLGSPNCQQDGVVLVTQASCTGQVVIPAKPSWIEANAATEIVNHVAAASSCKLEVVLESKMATGRPAIFIGNTEAASAVFDKATLRPEGYAVFVAHSATSRAAFIIGDDSPADSILGKSTGCNETWPNGKMTDNSDCRRGTLFGAYGLLRHIGFDWLWPDDTGTVVPDLNSSGLCLRSSLNLTDAPELLLRRYRPHYSNIEMVWHRWVPRVRWLLPNATIAQLADDESRWLARMGMGGHGAPQWGQAFGDWWDRYGSNGTLSHHPEWFALLPPHSDVNPGDVPRRGPWMHDKRLEVADVKMCVSNHQLWHQIVDGFLNGSAGVSACEDDGDEGFCTCSKCRAWDAPGHGPDDHCHQKNESWTGVGNCTGMYSDRYARFFDEVAGVLAERFPPPAGEEPPIVTGYAYSAYRDPPVSYTMKNNVMIGMVALGEYPATAESDAAGKAIWSGWHEAGAKKMFWRPNIGGMSPGAGPYQFSKGITANVAWLFGNGMVATDIDSLEGHWAQSGFSYWALAAAHWHPSEFDRDNELLGFCSRAFGSAAQHCLDYINFWERWTTKMFLDPAVEAQRHTDWVPRGSGSLTTMRVYDNATLDAGDSIIAALVQACGQSISCTKRAQFWANGLQHTRLTLAAIEAVNRSRTAGGGCTKQRTCDIGGPNSYLSQALELLRFRRKIASSSAVNVLSLSAEEVNGDVINGTHYTDMTGIQAAAGLESVTVNGYDTPEMSLSPVWGLAWDPSNAGLTDNPPWYSLKENRKNESKWQPTDITVGWNQTTTGAQWRASHFGKDYSGSAWYRSIFFVPDRLKSNVSQQNLAVAAVVCGQSADGWLNGVKMDLLKSEPIDGAPNECRRCAWKLSPITHRVVKGSVYENEIAFRVDGTTTDVRVTQHDDDEDGHLQFRGAPPPQHVLSPGFNSMVFVLNP